jgi:hypothetical protein
MLEKEFENNEICSCIFIKKTTSKFAIIVVYVNDLNLIGTHEELIKIVTYLKNEFEMKNLGIFFFILVYKLNIFQMKYLSIDRYIQKKVLKHFYINNVHPLSTSMIVRSLDTKKDIF